METFVFEWGPTAKDQEKVCDSWGTVGNSDPLQHSAGAEILHVGYQQNSRRGRVAKPIIWDQYVCASVFGWWEVQSQNSSSLKCFPPADEKKKSKIKSVFFFVSAFYTKTDEVNHSLS